MGRRLIGLAVYKVYRMRILSHEELRKMRYGMEVILNEMIKIAILTALFTILNKLNYFLISLVILITIRCFSGGLHFHSNFSCLLFSIIFLTAAAYSPIYLPVGFLRYRYLAMVLSIGAIGALSPIASINRPIRSKRKQRTLKFTAVLFTVFWTYILLFKIQDPGVISCGITTIMLQALQLIASYIFNLFKDINIGRRLRHENL